MALNKILSGMVTDFCTNNTFSQLEESKAYEYFVNYSIISKFHPEAFSDLDDIKVVDVDRQGSMFGLDCVAFVINDHLVLSKGDIETYSKANSLDVKIIFIQTKTAEKYDSGDILKSMNAIKNFFDNRNLLDDTEEMQNAFEIYDELCEYKNSRLFNLSSPKCYFYYITAARPCEDKLIHQICASQKNELLTRFPDIKDYEIIVAGSDYISNSYKEVSNRIEVKINLKNCLSLDKIYKVEQSYLGYLTGADFLNVIMDAQNNLRRRLFYENVRDYQGMTPVNAEIRKTLVDNSLHDKFILLNNGITIVARHLKALGSNEYEMTDFQIVNGCQTSNEIYRQKTNIQGVLVPVKIIHTTDTELISKIVRASNRQTMIPDEAFIAMEDYHKRLQDLFDAYSKQMPLKLYYERRSGEFDYLENRPRRYQVVTLHGLIRAVTSAYFLNAYIVYNNNPANILKNRRQFLFQEAHIPEIYYVSNYLLAQFLFFNFRKLFNSDKSRIKFYVVMVARCLFAKQVEVPELNSKAVQQETKNIINMLNGDTYTIEKIFVKSVSIVEEAIKNFSLQNQEMRKDEILRSLKFNHYIKTILDKYIKKGHNG